MAAKATGGKPKYDNRCTVSYPDSLYIEARKWATQKGYSIQEIQRRAMEFYVNHLNHEEVIKRENDIYRTKK